MLDEIEFVKHGFDKFFADDLGGINNPLFYARESSGTNNFLLNINGF